MSEFWSQINESGKGENGTITTQFPKIKEEFLTGIMNGPITKELLMFIFENGLSPSGNSYIITPKTLDNRVYCYTIDKEEFTGFALSLPVNVTVKNKVSSVTVPIGLTTLLTVSLKKRHSGIAQTLISSIIKYGNENLNIYSGYHYVKEPKTEFNVPVYTYYKILNKQKAMEAGYELVEPIELPVMSSFRIEKSSYEEWTHFHNKIDRVLYTSLSEDQFENLQQDCQLMSIKFKNKVVGVACYKTMMLRVAKKDKLCNVCRIMYFEAREKYAELALQVLITSLSGKEYSVMSGVCFGEMSNVKLLRKLGIATSGGLFLDFFNFRIQNEYRNAKLVNLFYL